MSGARVHYRNLHLTDKNARIFICNVCNKGFAVKDYMKKHMRVVHLSISKKSDDPSVENPELKQLKPNDCIVKGFSRKRVI